MEKQTGQHVESLNKDKTYYGQIDGTLVRLRAPKKPDKKLTEALIAMVKAVKNNTAVNVKGPAVRKIREYL